MPGLVAASLCQHESFVACQSSYSVCLKIGVMAQAIRAHERRFPELDQVQMQRAVCAFISAGVHSSSMVHLLCYQLVLLGDAGLLFRTCSSVSTRLAKSCHLSRALSCHVLLQGLMGPALLYPWMRMERVRQQVSRVAQTVKRVFSQRPM